MSGDGNDEEIVKLSIEGKVMMITIITMMMMMIMMMTSIFMMAMMMVMMPGARDPRGEGWKQDGIWLQKGEERKVSGLR